MTTERVRAESQSTTITVEFAEELLKSDKTMNNVPQKLRRQWTKEDEAGLVRVCLRADEGNCQGRLTKEHAVYYAGKQVQDDWAILDICEFHHGVGPFQDRGDLKKEKHLWIALNRAPEERLREMSKAEDKVALRDRLNAIYGVYKPVPPVFRSPFRSNQESFASETK